VRSNRSPAVSTHEHVPTGSHGNDLCKVAESKHLAIASAVCVLIDNALSTYARVAQWICRGTTNCFYIGCSGRPAALASEVH